MAEDAREEDKAEEPMTIPRFALTRESVPDLHAGQETMVYHALSPYPTVRSLEDLVQRCYANGYEMQQPSPPPSEVYSSILFHLRELKKRDIARED